MTVATDEGNLDTRWDSVFAEALAEVQNRHIEDPDKPIDFYTDGSCLDNGRPWAAAGWGVFAHNSAALGEHYGALPGNIQTNNRAELAAMEVALQLGWHSGRPLVRIFPDSNIACKGISNREDEWAWRKALGLDGWLARWERQGWRSASGKRVSHADIWRLILGWLRKFDSDPSRKVAVHHVRAHEGNAGNEKADELTKKGAKLRAELMLNEGGEGWFERTVAKYWRTRGR